MSDWAGGYGRRNRTSSPQLVVNDEIVGASRIGAPHFRALSLTVLEPIRDIGQSLSVRVEESNHPLLLEGPAGSTVQENGVEAFQ